MKITLCISMPNNGISMVANLVGAAQRTASGEHAVTLHITCHDEEQRAAILDAGLALPVDGVHIVEREPNTYRHSNSITHSRCVNALFSHATADVAVICDYDGAIVYKQWDKLLVDQVIGRKVAFLGSPYSPNLATLAQIGPSQFACMKYQNKPNCIFIAYEPARIRKLTSRLCDFSELFNSADAIPVRFVSNRRESAVYGLPISQFASLDTGSRVPELIADHQLPFTTLTRMTNQYRVFSIPDGNGRETDGLLHPEEYCWQDAPFFVHYRKGASKTGQPASQVDYLPEAFFRDVDHYLSVIA